MLKAILIGSLVLLPFVIAGKVLLVVLGASQELETAYLLLVGALAGIAGPIADIKVNGKEASQRRPPRDPGLTAKP
jgi:hypothetical protein